MFGLPPTTLLVIVGIPILWIAYTLIFYVSSSHWGDEDVEETPRSTPRSRVDTEDSAGGAQ